MNTILRTLADMSMQASWIIVAVIVVRYAFRNRSKKFRLALWAVVAFRLICPLSFEAPYSLGLQQQVVSGSAVASQLRQYSVTTTDNISATGISGTHMLSWIWAAGMVVLGCYAMMQYCTMRKKLSTAVILRDEIMMSDQIRTPFVMGVIHPHIYLPCGMDEKDIKYVIDHERMHVRYQDPYFRLMAWILTCVHWFNPVVWIGYRLFIQDIELICDERVIENYTSLQQADYSMAMVHSSMFASGMHLICPLGFGETGVKQRIRSIMNYRKPSFWITVVCIAVCVVTAACFLSHPQRTSFSIEITVPAGSDVQYYYASSQIAPRSSRLKVKCEQGQGEFSVVLRECENRDGELIEAYMEPGMSTYVDVKKGVWYDFGIQAMNPTQEDLVYTLQIKPVDLRIEDGVYGELEQYRSSYVGDASNSAGLAMNLPYGENFRYDHIELQTDTMPYGMTVYLKGTGNGTGLRNCAQIAFDLISNLDEMTFCKADGGEVIATYARNRLWAEKIEPVTGTWVLTIGNGSVSEIAIQMENESLYMNNANESLFKKGEHVSLSELPADADATVSARNRDHEVLFQAYVKDGLVEGMDLKVAEMDDWDLRLE